ncbi:Glucosyltransferase-like protein [Orbilia oligospora]|uniref:Alpha-1,3-glucosyltransferase n=1 Tax=Orbilia oligospora TaxID=2813651 RepID=A0A8H2HHI6_ORBOL|nr:Glucosyltransferase-like protein [Orbilia oligospora]
MAPPPSASHKARKRKRHVRSYSMQLPSKPFPLASFLHPLRTSSMRRLAIPTVLITAFIFRWAVTYGPYSGENTPPMYGDFEAQRHWMELTIHLPISEWYWYDLQWWGLDYPPLTAYHSWLCGKIGSLVNPSWFSLLTSRGHESYNHKVFMRATVAVSDYLIYIPAVVIFTKWCSRATGTDKYDRIIALSILLSSPGLIIIDYGHFQYNSLMLGLCIFAFASFLADRLLWGSLLFVMGLGFKQMGLYYAPAVFAYLAGLCVSFGGANTRGDGGNGNGNGINIGGLLKVDIQTLALLGITVISTFGIMVAPFAIFHGPDRTGLEQLGQMVHRVFPFARGLWEDKVANFWCATNIVFKYRERLSTPALQKISLLMTIIAILPPCLLLFLRPKKRLLPWGVAGCAWGFFLFSFQVHEKSVLLPMVAMNLVVAGGLDRDLLSWIGWANNVAMFSMWPLLKREGLGLQYTVLTALWSWLLSLHELPTSIYAKILHLGVYAGAIGLHIAELTVTEGIVERFPDIWVVGNVVLCFGAFGSMYIWVLYRMAEEAGLLDEYSVGGGGEEEKERLKKVE